MLDVTRLRVIDAVARHGSVTAAAKELHCADAGFDPRIGYSSDDMVVMQALVSPGLGVTTQTGLSPRAHHVDGVAATEVAGAERHIYAEPPDPPATCSRRSPRRPRRRLRPPAHNAAQNATRAGGAVGVGGRA